MSWEWRFERCELIGEFGMKTNCKINRSLIHGNTWQKDGGCVEDIQAVVLNCWYGKIGEGGKTRIVWLLSNGIWLKRKNDFWSKINEGFTIESGCGNGCVLGNVDAASDIKELIVDCAWAGSHDRFCE